MAHAPHDGLETTTIGSSIINGYLVAYMMNRFKQDVTYYLLGIIIPGAINFLAIPVFKRMLGESLYGEFTLLFTALLISNTALVGWIGQSVIRVGMQAADKKRFMAYSLWVSMLPVALAAIVALPLLRQFGFSWGVSCLFAACLISSSQQVTLVSVSQGFFRARLTMFTEALRVLTFFITGFCLLHFTGPQHGVEKLFAALLVSTLISATALARGNQLFQHLLQLPHWPMLRQVAAELFHYGIYLMLWFLLNYALMYGDRYLIAWQYGNIAAGNYAALFDMIGRSISLLGTPVLAAIFPIITNEYEAGKLSAINKLIRQIITIQFAILVAGLFAYHFIGFNLLSWLLKLPEDGSNFYWPGFFIICGSVMGQVGMVLHKRMELKKQTKKMLFCVTVAFLTGMAAAFLLLKPLGMLGTSIAYLLATGTYAILVYSNSAHSLTPSAVAISTSTKP